MLTNLQSRFAQLPGPPPDAALSLRPGTWADYAALAEHHYRGARPATATRIFALVSHTPTATQRFLGHPSREQTVGVLVESMPSLGCRLRDIAMGGRYAIAENRTQRARLLNAEVRCISRVVVHPQWRGLGLAVRLVRHALATATTRYTEALAAMGHASPFFEHAGMTAYRRPPHPCDARLIDVLGSAGFHATDLAALDSLLDRIAALTGARRVWIEREAKRWWRQAHRAAPVYANLRQQLQAARSRVLMTPVYYLAARAQDCSLK